MKRKPKKRVYEQRLPSEARDVAKVVYCPNHVATKLRRLWYSRLDVSKNSFRTDWFYCPHCDIPIKIRVETVIEESANPTPVLVE